MLVEERLDAEDGCGQDTEEARRTVLPARWDLTVCACDDSVVDSQTFLSLN